VGVNRVGFLKKSLGKMLTALFVCSFFKLKTWIFKIEKKNWFSLKIEFQNF